MNKREKFLAVFLFLAVFVNFLGPINDPDFPFHLKTGEYIYTHKEIPVDDPFSFYGEGVVTDRERFTLGQYWLAQIIFFKLYSLTGPSGIILLRALFFSIFIFLIWLVLKKRGLFFPIIITVAVAVLLQAFKLDRPQFFSFLFTLILILLFEKFREKSGSIIPLLFIPPLFLLWANMHAGFVYGIVAMIIYSVAEALKLFVRHRRFCVPMQEKAVLILLIFVFISILFSYLNPIFNEQIITTIESHTEARWLYKEVREYMSPVKEMSVHFGSRISAVIFFFIFGLVSSTFMLNAVRTKSVDITALLLIVFSSVSAFTAIRYIPFFLAVALPVTRDYKFLENSFFLKKLKNSVTVSILVIVFFAFAIIYGLRDYKNIFSIDSSKYPVKVANFLLSNRVDANIFNHFNKGSYLLWRLYPHYRVFNDTRFISLEAVNDTDAITYTLEDYNRPMNLALAKALAALVPKELGEIKTSTAQYAHNTKNIKPLWKKLLDEYNINLIVHEACAPYTKDLYPLVLRLLKDDEWVLIYLDGTMLIFVRDTEKYSSIIKKFKLPKELIYDEIIFEALPFVKRKVPSSPPYSSLGFAYMMRGSYQSAKIMIDAALALDKNDLVANFCEAYLALIRKAQEKSSASKGK